LPEVRVVRGSLATRRRTLAILLTLLALGGLMLAPVATAFELRSGDNLLIERGVTVDDDLYAAGDTVTVDGTIRGDAFLAGRTVIVNGSIEGALFAAAQTVIVNGTVGGSARVAAEAIAIGPGAMIGRDLLVLGYSLETRPGSTVGRDVAVASYQALLAGSVARHVSGALGGLELRGPISGDVRVEVGDRGPDASTRPFAGPPVPGVAIPPVPPGLTVAPPAAIGGALAYTAREQYPITGQVAGGVQWTPRQEQERPAGDSRQPLAHALQRFLTLALVGLLLLWLAPRWLAGLAQIVETQPLPTLGWGVVAGVAFVGAVMALAVIAVALAVLFGVATLAELAVLALGLGFLAEVVGFVAFAVVTGYIAQVAVGYVGGRWILQTLRPDWTTGRPLPLIIGLLLFVLLSAVPVLGAFLQLVVAILGLGAVWIWARERIPLPARVNGMGLSDD
jgi:cytoskeletal protein CcmA (bactofilin family)